MGTYSDISGKSAFTPGFVTRIEQGGRRVGEELPRHQIITSAWEFECPFWLNLAVFRHSLAISMIQHATITTQPLWLCS